MQGQQLIGGHTDHQINKVTLGVALGGMVGSNQRQSRGKARSVSASIVDLDLFLFVFVKDRPAKHYLVVRIV